MEGNTTKMSEGVEDCMFEVKLRVRSTTTLRPTIDPGKSVEIISANSIKLGVKAS